MPLHLFEFMDHARTPQAIRQTLLDVLDFCNRDFRPHYQDIAAEILRHLKGTPITQVVELGAGTAPITQALAGSDSSEHLRLIPSDLYPEPTLWKKLENQHPKQVQPAYHPVDFTIPQQSVPGSSVVLSATLHHIPTTQRMATLQALAESADLVLIFEPVQKNPVSMFLVLFAVIPALLTPLARWTSPGSVRRVLWCWLVPIVPLMFVWDGLVSCIRQWNRAEWDAATEKLQQHSIECTADLRLHSATIILRMVRSRPSHD